MNTSEVLNKAADLIEERGWGEGPESWGGGDEGGRLCLEGGIAVAAGVGSIGSVLLDECPAARAVHSYLGLASDLELWDWNDLSGTFCKRYNMPMGARRTQAEVVEVLRAAAIIAAASELDVRVVGAPA